MTLSTGFQFRTRAKWEFNMMGFFLFSFPSKSLQPSEHSHLDYLIRVMTAAGQTDSTAGSQSVHRHQKVIPVISEDNTGPRTQGTVSRHLHNLYIFICAGTKEPRLGPVN